jgi:hypothetical protein
LFICHVLAFAKQIWHDAALGAAQMKALSATQLAAHLSKIAERYEKLRTIFREFCAKSAALLTANDSPVPGIKHFFDLPNNMLCVEFCGKSYEFDFKMDHVTGKGVVTCTLPGRHPQKDRIVVGSFAFVGNADSDVLNSHGENLRMVTPDDASHLILHMIYQDLSPAAAHSGSQPDAAQ